MARPLGSPHNTEKNPDGIPFNKTTKTTLITRKALLNVIDKKNEQIKQLTETPDLLDETMGADKEEVIVKSAIRGSNVHYSEVPDNIKRMILVVHAQALARGRVATEQDIIDICKAAKVDFSEWNLMFQGPMGVAITRWIEELALKRVMFNLSRGIDNMMDIAMNNKGMAAIAAFNVLTELTGTKRRAGATQTGHLGAQWTSKYLVDGEGKPIKPKDMNVIADVEPEDIGAESK
jgi:hypothetical protein